jgi:hypothetical protein
MIAIQCISNSGGVNKTEFWAYADKSMRVLTPGKLERYRMPTNVVYKRIVVPEREGKNINSGKVYHWFVQEKYLTESFDAFILTIHPY